MLAGSFNGLLDRLHQEFERQKRFSGDASHQLRTPLAALLGQLEVAQRRERSVEEYQRVLDEVHGEALRLRQIVESLLFMARAESEAGTPELEPVELVLWVRERLASHSARREGRGLEGAVRRRRRRRGCRRSRSFWGSCSTTCWTTPASTVRRGTPITVEVGREGEHVTPGGAGRGAGD